jgi:hypothetical protein
MAGHQPHDHLTGLHRLVTLCQQVTGRPKADVLPCRNDSQPLLARNAVWGPLMIPG